MTNFHVISYVLGNYFIRDIKVEVYYAPAVLESFYSKKEIVELIQRKRDKDVVDGIFEIIKSRTSELKVFEVWYDLIEYRGIELIWKSFFDAKKKMMGVKVLYSRGNNNQEELVH